MLLKGFGVGQLPGVAKRRRSGFWARFFRAKATPPSKQTDNLVDNAQVELTPEEFAHLEESLKKLWEPASTIQKGAKLLRQLGEKSR
jgi:hypothetical protein